MNNNSKYAMALAALAIVATPALACMTLTEAAQAALHEAMQLSHRYEFGGALYATEDGCHHYTAPATSKRENSVKLHIRLPAGSTLTGIYHTHPGKGSKARRFSPDDVTAQRVLDVPSFIGVVRSASILSRGVQL